MRSRPLLRRVLRLVGVVCRTSQNLNHRLRDLAQQIVGSREEHARRSGCIDHVVSQPEVRQKPSRSLFVSLIRCLLAPVFHYRMFRYANVIFRILWIMELVVFEIDQFSV
jgi:hypothetical protein